MGTYLQEEIRNEGLVRSIEAFSRFLRVAALHNAEELNFTSCALDAQVPSRTIREYFHVLEDTLIGHSLPPFQKTTKRKPVATAKFYWFDTGVANVLVGRKSLTRGTPEFGRALEHQIFIELRAYLDYQRIDLPLCYWRTTSKFEVDFVVGDSIAIEVKAGGRVGDNDLKGIRALAEEFHLKKKIVVAGESIPRKTEDGIEVLPLDVFLKRLWQSEIF